MSVATDRETLNLSAGDFTDLFDINEGALPEQLCATLAETDFRYTAIVGAEREACLLRALKAVDEEDLSVAGPERRGRWEEGWQENLDEYLRTGSLQSLHPKYYHYEYLRFRGSYIRAASVKFEQDFYAIVRQILFNKYLSEATSVVEFGCGTGTSLLLLSEMFPDKPLVGCDWAASSQRLLEAIARKTGKKIAGINFDMFHPRDDVPFADGCAVITMAAMEQLGTRYEAFLNYIIAKRPAVCLHLEPLIELYDENELFDYVAMRYHQKRGYLNGFLTSLRGLEAAGKVSVIDVRRLSFGSFHHEGYSVVAWRPLV